ncbi:MAG: hypothetical protein IPN57_08510 [Ignavibacteria bacterium]|nr:hypothetical protein [Ignavibacteria bacterium]
MKKLILKIAMLIAVTFLLNGSAYSANEYFRSVNSGNWNSNSTWQMSTNGGGTWFAATSTPTDTSGPITIQSPNTVTVSVNVNADQLTVNNGGILSVNTSIVFTLKDGSGEDLLLNPGGIVSGAGTFQTQGTEVSINVRNGSTFSTALKVNTGKLTSYDSSSPNIAYYNGTMTIDAGAVLNVLSGGYKIQARNNVTNNGEITSNAGGIFYMSGLSLINNDTIKGDNVIFDDTTSLSGTGAYTSNDISIAGTGNVSLANNLTFSPASNFNINSGGVLNLNTRTFTFNRGTFFLLTGGTVLNSGIFQTQSAVSLIIRNGTSFNAPLKVNTGTATSYNDGFPNIANYNGTLTIDAGATFTSQSGGYTNRIYGNVTNNGTISGNNFIMRGPSLTNNGSISSVNFQFDSVTSVTSTGTYTSNTITIGETGNITLISNVTFTPGSSFSVSNGGVFNPGAKTFTFASGSFILNTGAVVSGSGPSAGTMQSQNNVNFIFRNGSTFNSAIKVNTGILTAYNDQSPFIAVFSGSIAVDAGATLTQISGGYTTKSMNTVTNNGTITSPNGGNSFRMRGNLFINNSSVTCQNLYFDSTTTLTGTGTYTGQSINIGTSGNVTLANNITFSPVIDFDIDGILNLNTKTLTFNSGTFRTNSGGTVLNSGLFQTQGSVSVINRNSSAFNAPFKVSSGTTLAYNNVSPFFAVFNGPITVDAGATLTGSNGGYTLQANNTVTNNGIISGSGTHNFRMKGSSLVNNNSITSYELTFDSTTSVSGAGTFTSSLITIGGSGNVSLGSNVTISPVNNFTVNTGGILNPNAFTFTATGALYFNNGSSVTNSGIFRTQGSTNLICKAGCSFNPPLKINTGTTFLYDNGSPFIGTVNGIITVDAGAVLSCLNGGYTVRANNDVINNGTITASGSPLFRMYGTNFTNNGSINFSNFNFESGAHTLSGTGSWLTNADIISGSTLTLTSNHQMHSVNVNAGGTFNLSTFKLSLTASNPISNSGTFNTTTAAVEYNGTSLQSISTTNITYNKLRINNSAGTSLPNATTVNDSLSVILGDLNLNGFVLTLAPAGYLTETAGNTVTGTSGYITTTRTINAPSALNVAGLGAVLTTAVNLGSTEIRRGHAVQSGLGGNTSFLRYFDITPATNTGLNATLVYKYDDSELNGKVESASSLFKSTNSGTNWTSQGGTVNTSANTITLSGVGSFSRWSASSVAAVAAQIKLIMEGFYNPGTGKLNKRDTVRAYLRNITTPFAIIDSAKSVIDSVTFTGSFLFTNTASGTYYIQTKHRNSIETWSKSGGQPYTLGSVLSYDFTSAAAQSYGNNMIQVNASPLRFGVYSGDINQDGTVDASDVSEVDNDSYNSLSGYVRTDVTGDNFVDATDVSIIDNNANSSVNLVRP